MNVFFKRRRTMAQFKFKSLMLTSIFIMSTESSHSGQATPTEGMASKSVTGLNNATTKAFADLYGDIHQAYEEMGGKAPKKENLTPSLYNQEIKELLREIKGMKCDQKPVKRDFHAEYEKLIMALSTVGDKDKKEAERLNLAIGRLETEAQKAGVHLGESAEKAEMEGKAKELDLQKKQALAAAKDAEIQKDIDALKTKDKWLTTMTGPQHQEEFHLTDGTQKLSLVDLLKMPDKDLFPIIMNIKTNPIVAKLIAQESDERVGRALRAWAQAQLDKKRATPLSYVGSEALKNIIHSVDSHLGSKGSEGSSVSSSGGGFVASPEDKEAYQKFQYVWGEAQKNPSSKVNRDITRVKSTDELTKFILLSENELKAKTFDKNIRNRLQLSSATPLELRAFTYALSLAQTGSISGKELMELKKKIEDQIAITEHQIANLKSIKELAMHAKASDISARALEESTIAEKQFGGTSTLSKKTGAPPLPPKGLGVPPPPSYRPPVSETTESNSSGRNAFLDEIAKGRKLKKVEPKADR